GVVAYGDDVFKAFFRMDTVEHSARITLVAELLGGCKLLPREEIQKLFDSRRRYGVRSQNRYEPGWPLCAEDQSDSRMDDNEKMVVSREEFVSLMDEAFRVRSS